MCVHQVGIEWEKGNPMWAPQFQRLLESVYSQYTVENNILHKVDSFIMVVNKQKFPF